MGRVGRQRLARLVGGRTGISEATVRRVLRATFEAIAEELARGNTVTVTDFGSWRTKVYAPRTGRHPRDGSRMKIPPRTRVVFKAGSQLRNITESSLDPEVYFGLGVAQATEVQAAFARLFGLDQESGLREGAKRLAAALHPDAHEQAAEFFEELMRKFAPSEPEPKPEVPAPAEEA